MAWTYILRCADGSYYSGSTRDLDRRIAQHTSGEGGDYTCKRLPVELVGAEESDHISTAYALEKKIQGCRSRTRPATPRTAPQSRCAALAAWSQ